MAEQALRPVEDEAVDIDLDAQDEALRAEAVGDMTTVKIKGTVIHILHAADWTSACMRAAVTADWNAWASLVIPDEKELEAWMEADLHNYQVEAVFEQAARKAKMNTGKSRKPSGSSRNTRRR